MTERPSDELDSEGVVRLQAEAEEANRAFWDEVAPVHYRSYDLAALRRGGVCLDAIQLREVGDVAGRDLLHLQCHIGTDTLSWARLGARVTGVDFSAESLAWARRLQRELGLPARFVHSNVYDLDQVLDARFDIVYTSKGVLCWLRDLCSWAQVVARHLRPGGFLYLMDGHPLSSIFDDQHAGDLRVAYSYFGGGRPKRWEGGDPDYAEPAYRPQHPTYEWTWTLGDIFNSLIAAGLVVEFLHEHDKAFHQALPGMVEDQDGWWYLPEHRGRLPHTFSLKATRPPTQEDRA
jgi:SAM-dependent methyltransferase